MKSFFTSYFFALSILASIVGSSAHAQVLGDASSLEAGLQGRSDVLFFGGFELGGLDASSWAGDWGVAWTEGYNDTTRVNDSTAFDGKSLKVAYYDTRNSGLVFNSSFQQLGITPDTSMYMRYYVKFENNFDFVLGGKLPGLSAVKPVTGGLPVDGTNGWSSRLMWRDGGKIVVYAYLVEVPAGVSGNAQWGIDIPFDYNNNGVTRKFIPGQWHCVEIYNKLNDVGAKNGKIYAWLDGVLSVKHDDIVFRTVDNTNTKIGTLDFSSFFGGQGDQWAPSHLVHIWYDNFVLAKNYIGVKSGVAPAPTATATATPTPTGTATPSSTWQNQSFTSQSSVFLANFDITPKQDAMDGVTGLSAGPIAAYSDAAVLVRFNNTGMIDARDGANYSADTSIPYKAGQAFHVRLRIDVPNHTYDAFVTPTGGSERLLASGYAFRTEQASVASLANFGSLASAGSLAIANFTVSKSTFSITASAGAGGVISPSGAISIGGGASQTLTISPNSGYTIAGVTVDGASVGAVSSYTFSNVQAYHTIVASFVSTGWTSSTIWQNKAVTSQNAGFIATFDAIPNANNMDGIVAFSGVPIQGFTDGAVLVAFMTSGTIGVRNGGAYTALTPVTYSAGKSYHFRLSIDVAKKVFDAWVTPAGGSEIQIASKYAFRTEQANLALINNVGIFADIGSHSVSNLTLSQLYTLSVSGSAGGSILPAGPVVLASGATQTFQMTPNSGYKVANVTVDGASVGAVSSYTFSNVVKNHTIAVSFASTGSTSGTTWKNTSLSPQTGSFVASYDAVPNANNMDGIVAFSGVPIQGFTDGAVLVAFMTNGTIGVRNGGAYAALASVPYVAGKSYHFRLNVDVANKVYNVWVTPAGGSEIQIASKYAFRTEQAKITQLNNFGIFADIGTHSVANLLVTTVAGPAPTPTPTVTVTPTPTPTPTPSPTATNRLIYDTFTDTNGKALTSHVGELNSTWVQGWNANCYIDGPNGAAYSTTDGNIRNAGKLSTGDYSVIATMKAFGYKSGTNAGVSGRVQASSNGRYAADFAHGLGWRLFKAVNGTETQLGRTYLDPVGGTDFVNGSTHKVELRMKGSTISMYIDGVLAVSATDTTFSSGSAGLETAEGSQGTMYEFLDFAVTPAP